MNGMQIREKLRAGEPVFGTHIASLMNPNAAVIAAEMPLDFAFFCTEHMPLDRTELGLLCRLYSSYGISPMVRVPSPDPYAVSTALDGGAQGIVVPYVETVEEVQRVAAAVKYRPIKGRLLQNAIDGKEPFSPKLATYLNRFNQDSYLIIGIESVPAIENLESLLTAAEVDGVFLGPHDITTSMGIPEEYENPEFLDAMVDVIERCRRLGVGVGIHTALLKLKEKTLRRLLDAGMNFIINGADVTVMRDAMTAQLTELRRLAGETKVTSRQVERRRLQSCIT